MRRLLLLLVAGCAGPTIIVSGYPLVADYWNGINIGVRPKASFVMSCPEERLQLRVLDAHQNELGYYWVRQVGAEGCGHRAIFATSDHGWEVKFLDK